MKNKILSAISLTTLLIFCSNAYAADNTDNNQQWKHYPTPKKAPKGAPNIIIVMTDDIGFGASDTFGGKLPTPNLDELAENGIKYNKFHTTAMSSPSRAALLTGRNHHAVNTGAISDLSLDRDGLYLCNS